MNLNEYRKWRDDEIRRVGLQTQLKAEDHLERHEKAPMIEVADERQGCITRYKKPVADVLIARKDCRTRAYYSFPSTTFESQWERIFGHG